LRKKELGRIQKASLHSGIEYDIITIDR
jgi:hypothetical protein